MEKREVILKDPTPPRDTFVEGQPLPEWLEERLRQSLQDYTEGRFHTWEEVEAELERK